MLILALFYLKAYLRCTEPFRIKPDGSRVTSLLLGNNRQHRPVCAKTISSWVGKFFVLLKQYVSRFPPRAAASAALAAGVSLVSILQAGDSARVFTLARHYFSPYITIVDWHQDSAQCAMLGLSE